MVALAQMFYSYTGRDVKFLKILIWDFPQQSNLSLSHASTHTQQPNQYNNYPTIDPEQQDTTTIKHIFFNVCYCKNQGA